MGHAADYVANETLQFALLDYDGNFVGAVHEPPASRLVRINCGSHKPGDNQVSQAYVITLIHDKRHRPKNLKPQITTLFDLGILYRAGSYLNCYDLIVRVPFEELKFCHRWGKKIVSS